MTNNIKHHKTPALINFDLEQVNIKIVVSIYEMRDLYYSVSSKSEAKKFLTNENKFQKVLNPFVSILKSELYKDLLPEMILCRTVDNFQCYLADVLFILFRSRPEILRSSEKVTVEEVLSASSMDEFVENIAERKVEGLSYQGFKSIYKYLIDHIGIRAGINELILNEAIQAIALRNIIVHNRSKVNSRYFNETKRTDVKMGDIITLIIDDAQKHMVAIESIAIDIDALLTEKFGGTCFHKFCESKEIEAPIDSA